jgi:predicted DNA-binding transcriptional regulator AlpA
VKLQVAANVSVRSNFDPVALSSSNNDQIQNPSRFLDCEQAAVFLGGLNPRTVNRWAREGYVPSYPIGEGKRRLWRFLESDLQQWMLSRRTGTLPSAVDAPIRGLVQ